MHYEAKINLVFISEQSLINDMCFECWPLPHLLSLKIIYRIQFVPPRPPCTTMRLCKMTHHIFISQQSAVVRGATTQSSSMNERSSLFCLLFPRSFIWFVWFLALPGTICWKWPRKNGFSTMSCVPHASSIASNKLFLIDIKWEGVERRRHTTKFCGFFLSSPKTFPSLRFRPLPNA